MNQFKNTGGMKIKVLRQNEGEIVSAKDLFLATRKKSQLEKMDGIDLHNAFRSWICDRISNFEMEEGFDFFIYLNIRCAGELVKYESVPDGLKMFFESKLMEGETA
jgi:phage anti-repressor protein